MQCADTSSLHLPSCLAQSPSPARRHRLVMTATASGDSMARPSATLEDEREATAPHRSGVTLPGRFGPTQQPPEEMPRVAAIAPPPVPRTRPHRHGVTRRDKTMAMPPRQLMATELLQHTVTQPPRPTAPCRRQLGGLLHPFMVMHRCPVTAPHQATRRVVRSAMRPAPSATRRLQSMATSPIHATAPIHPIPPLATSRCSVPGKAATSADRSLTDLPKPWTARRRPRRAPGCKWLQTACRSLHGPLLPILRSGRASLWPSYAASFCRWWRGDCASRPTPLPARRAEHAPCCCLARFAPSRTDWPCGRQHSCGLRP